MPNSTLKLAAVTILLAHPVRLYAQQAAQLFPVAVLPANQTAATDGKNAQALYADLNSRLAPLCPEPARACVLSYAAFQRCRASATPDTCGEAPVCSANFTLTSADFRALGAVACSAKTSSYFTLAPDWFTFFTNQGRSGTFSLAQIDFPPVKPGDPNAAVCTAAEMWAQARMQYLIKAAPMRADGEGPILHGLSLGPPIKQVAPVYPTVARAARIQGAVVLRVLIAADGSVASLDAISGPPLLINAAMTAVRQWQFRTAQINGQPNPYESTVTVNFNLQTGIASTEDPPPDTPK